MKIRNIILFVIVVCLLVSAAICIPDKLKTNINKPDDKAFYSELVEINGIGPVTAERAVVYRRIHKPIKINDLDNIKGVGEYRLHLINKEFKD